jgi:hypothetical protein
MLIEVPTNAKVIDMPSSIIWLDKDGILYSVGKTSIGPRSIDDLRAEMRQLRNVIGEGKYCIIMESNGKGPTPPKEQRDEIARELNSVTKALAVVSSSPLGRMMANLFFSFKPPKYPMKLFSNEQEARAWIKQYLYKQDEA